MHEIHFREQIFVFVVLLRSSVSQCCFAYVFAYLLGFLLISRLPLPTSIYVWEFIRGYRYRLGSSVSDFSRAYDIFFVTTVTVTAFNSAGIHYGYPIRKPTPTLIHAQYDWTNAAPDNGNEWSDSVKRHLRGRHLSVLNLKFDFISDGGCTREEQIALSLKRHLFPHGGREPKVFWICFSRVHPPSEIKSNFKFKTLKRHLLKRHLTLSEMEEVPRRTSLAPLAFPRFLLCLIGMETEGFLDCQGRAGIISIDIQRSAKGKRNEKNQIWLKTQNFFNVHRLQCQYRHLCPEVESSFGALQWPYGA